jgi:hypothetical protein
MAYNAMSRRVTDSEIAAKSGALYTTEDAMYFLIRAQRLLAASVGQFHRHI